jgi:hypothetical protein
MYAPVVLEVVTTVAKGESPHEWLPPEWTEQAVAAGLVEVSPWTGYYTTTAKGAEVADALAWRETPSN